MAKSTCVNDHVVISVNDEDFNSPPSWLSDNFTIIEGGTHTGGSSRNKLICFTDGSYLELFNWIGKPKEFLDWADKPEGFIDFALTTLSPIDADGNYQRTVKDLKKYDNENEFQDFMYEPPKAGARKRMDGKQIAWKTTRSKVRETGKGFSAVPFFCHDTTERKLRVAYDDPLITTHPCGATGIAEIHISVPPSEISIYSKLYTAILGAESVSSDAHSLLVFKIGSVVNQGYDPTIHIVQKPDKSSMLVGNDDGIIGLRLLVPSKKQKFGERLGDAGIAAQIFI